MRTYHRNAAIFAGIFTLIQGAIWASFAVWSVGIYSCTFDYPYYTKESNTVANLFFYSYLLGTCRVQASQLRGTVLGPPHRTYAIMLTYGILSAIWIPSAILILVAAVNKIHGKAGARCYYPGLVVTGCLIIMDIVTTVIYGMEVSNTMTVKNYLQTFPYVPPINVRGMDGLTVLPAVLMTIFSCRFLIIWIINVTIFSLIIQVILSLKKRSPAADFVEREVRMKPSEQSSPGGWVHVGGRRQNMDKRSPGRRDVGVPEIELSPTRSPAREERESRPPGPPARWSAADLLVQSPSEERQQPNFSQARSPARPTTIQIPKRSTSPPDTSSPVFNVLGQPTTPDSPQPISPRPVISCSNQLPWSYVNPNQLPPPPKLIPEPDYTIHPGPNRRPNLISSSTTTPSDEEEIRPVKRYENNPKVWKVMLSSS